jgi:hypothetical protein
LFSPLINLILLSAKRNYHAQNLYLKSYSANRQAALVQVKAGAVRFAFIAVELAPETEHGSRRQGGQDGKVLSRWPAPG